MNFKAPDDLEESQCATIPAYRGVISGGSVDGIPVVVVAWLPHFLTTDFYTATHPA